MVDRSNHISIKVTCKSSIPISSMTTTTRYIAEHGGSKQPRGWPVLRHQGTLHLLAPLSLLMVMVLPGGPEPSSPVKLWRWPTWLLLSTRLLCLCIWVSCLWVTHLWDYPFISMSSNKYKTYYYYNSKYLFYVRIKWSNWQIQFYSFSRSWLTCSNTFYFIHTCMFQPAIN